MINSLNIHNHSKTSAFKKLKHKYYLTFAKVHKKQPNRMDIRKFLVLLYDYVPHMKHVQSVWNIDRLLSNANVLQVRTGRNLTTHLYIETTKPDKNANIRKRYHAY